MSYTIMPTLPLSMAHGLKKSPAFNTALQKVAAGRGNASVSLTPYALWDMEFDLDHITGNEALLSSHGRGIHGNHDGVSGSQPTISFH